MAEEAPDRESFINRKRPAVVGLIEDVIGPTAQYDEFLFGKDLATNDEANQEKLDKFDAVREE